METNSTGQKRSRLAWLVVALAFLPLVAGALAYAHLPDQIASHWNAAGEVDGYMGKFWGTFLLPLVSAGMLLLYAALPKLDPQKPGIAGFRKQYDGFWAVLFLFFAYVYGLQLAWNFGHRFDFGKAMVPALAVLWFVTGAVLRNAKRNWFMGIRTPWTLTNDVVWEKTHRLGGTLFKWAGIATLLGLFLPGSGPLIAAIAPVLIVAVVTVAYSYVVYSHIAKTPKQ